MVKNRDGDEKGYLNVGPLDSQNSGIGPILDSSAATGNEPDTTDEVEEGEVDTEVPNLPPEPVEGDTTYVDSDRDGVPDNPDAVPEKVALLDPDERPVGTSSLTEYGETRSVDDDEYDEEEDDEGPDDGSTYEADKEAATANVPTRSNTKAQIRDYLIYEHGIDPDDLQDQNKEELLALVRDLAE